MTHFKGAAFGCQRSAAGANQAFLLGSHNFDPRSGRADKDYALVWEEPSPDCGSLLNSELVSGRFAIYAALKKARNTNVLVEYSDLFEELEQVANRYDTDSEETRQLALAFKNVFYESTPNGYRVSYAEKALHLLKLIDKGGLHDLIGSIF